MAGPSPAVDLHAVVVIAVLRSAELGLHSAQYGALFTEDRWARCCPQRDRRMLLTLTAGRAARLTRFGGGLIVHGPADESIVIVAVEADGDAGLDHQILRSADQNEMLIIVAAHQDQ